MVSSDTDQVGELPGARDKTPPTKEGPGIHSTPAGKGTASDAQHKHDPRVTVGENAALIEEDLKSTQTVPLITMLRAMIMKKRIVEGGDVLNDEDLERHGRTQLEELLTASVKFCNERASDKLKENITVMLKRDSETGRYRPLAIGLNSVLVDFEGRAVGALGKPAAKDAAIYAVNDPTVIVSKPISDYGEGTKTKPDVCLFKFDSYLKLVGNATPNATVRTIAGMMEHADSRQLLKKVDGVKLDWSDIVTCIELKKSPGVLAIRPPRLDQAYDANSMMITEHQASTESKRSAQLYQKDPGVLPHGGKAVSSSAKINVPSGGVAVATGSQSRVPKRRAESEHPREGTGSKKHKTSQSNAKASTSDTSSGKLRPDAQCAVYGIELLRSRWDKTHSIVLLLRDHYLSLRWYDSQGCIATADIDIIEHLPLLVAVVVLMQRFKQPMRGLPAMDFKATIDDKEIPFAIPESTQTRWELKGRRPATGFPVAKDRASQDTNAPPPARITRANSGLHRPDDIDGDLDDLFFKWSWREETRDSEYTIIAAAKERARRYLPPDHVGDILNHLPDVKYGQDFEIHSTSHIRKYAGIPTTGARIPSMILFKKLESIDGIGGKVLAKKIWDVIRCTWLLWAIGVAHGDISYWNIMVDPTTKKLVLNDFDLASLMKPGDESPSKKGFERTGTKPFMAIKLMDNADGSLKRTRRHELESFFWIFAWTCEGDASKVRWEWNAPSFLQAMEKKSHYYYERLNPNGTPKTIKEEDKEVWRNLCGVATSWKIADLEDVNSGDGPRPPAEFLESFGRNFVRDPEYLTWDWVGFEVPQDT